jgi:hypothetical protein
MYKFRPAKLKIVATKRNYPSKSKICMYENPITSIGKPVI